ncbi:hypothetical protein CEUSTIGMA_g8050.t1 [Chlamydomonas eustigma]|uniref:Uncharacterized protein n=1 Tax=Chlamydomonas eustigma TaxID=1157962 RepID=A0A250XBZ9_9CHLO|nr:hypothetical protein CEUSTIGMA_g8050.t1 [Chlamydomonas eustigma]|eukprot:GAX80615.1 hypothetical protein CEUSTIGMA_g8050.t1 [Chlamydomonas eustigma]
MNDPGQKIGDWSSKELNTIPRYREVTQQTDKSKYWVSDNPGSLSSFERSDLHPNPNKNQGTAGVLKKLLRRMSSSGNLKKSAKAGLRTSAPGGTSEVRQDAQRNNDGNLLHPSQYEETEVLGFNGERLMSYAPEDAETLASTSEGPQADAMLKARAPAQIHSAKDQGRPTSAPDEAGSTSRGSSRDGACQAVHFAFGDGGFQEGSTREGHCSSSGRKGLLQRLASLGETKVRPEGRPSSSVTQLAVQQELTYPSIPLYRPSSGRGMLQSSRSSDPGGSHPQVAVASAMMELMRPDYQQQQQQQQAVRPMRKTSSSGFLQKLAQMGHAKVLPSTPPRVSNAGGTDSILSADHSDSTQLPKGLQKQDSSLPSGGAKPGFAQVQLLSLEDVAPSPRSATKRSSDPGTPTGASHREQSTAIWAQLGAHMPSPPELPPRPGPRRTPSFLSRLMGDNPSKAAPTPSSSLLHMSAQKHKNPASQHSPHAEDEDPKDVVPSPNLMSRQMPQARFSDCGVLPNPMAASDEKQPERAVMKNTPNTAPAQKITVLPKARVLQYDTWEASHQLLHPPTTILHQHQQQQQLGLSGKGIAQSPSTQPQGWAGDGNIISSSVSRPLGCTQMSRRPPLTAISDD